MNFLAHLFDYLFGTYRRFIGTIIILGIIIVVLNPQILTIVFCRILSAIMPILAPLLQLVIILAVLYAMWNSFLGRRR